MPNTPTKLKFINGTFCKDCYAGVATYGGVLITVRPLIDLSGDTLSVGYRARVVPLKHYPQFTKESNVTPMELTAEGMVKMFPEGAFFKASDQRCSFFRLSNISMAETPEEVCNTVISKEFIEAMVKTVYVTFEQVSPEVKRIATEKDIGAYFDQEYREFIEHYREHYLTVDQSNVTSIESAKKD